MAWTRVTISKNGKELAEAYTRCPASNWRLAAETVYNRTVRPHGTRLEYVALSEELADGVYRATMGTPGPDRSTHVTQTVIFRIYAE